MAGISSSIEKFESSCAQLDVPESEDTWKDLESAFLNIAQFAEECILSDDYDNYTTLFANQLKRIKPSVLRCFQSERTRLLKAAIKCVSCLSMLFKRTLDSAFAESLFPAVLKLCTKANKVVVRYALESLSTIAQHSQPTALCPVFARALGHQNKTYRAAAVQFVYELLNCAPPDCLEPQLATVEGLLRSGISDAAPEVREWSRKAIGIVLEKFPTRHDQFLASLSDNARKTIKGFRANGAGPPLPLKNTLRPSLKQSISSQKAALKVAPMQQKTSAAVAQEASITARANARRTMLPGALRELVQKSDVDSTQASATRVASCSAAIPPKARVLSQSKAFEGMSKQLSEGLSAKARRCSDQFESVRSYSASNLIPSSASHLSAEELKMRERNLSTSALSTALPLEAEPMRLRAQSLQQASRKNRRVSMAVIPMTVSLTEKFNCCVKDSVSEDWAVRSSALEQLARLIKDSGAIGVRSKFSKVHSLISAGLSDSHFRVVQNAVECLESLTLVCKPLQVSDEERAIMRYMEDFILKMLIILSQQPTKARATLLHKSSSALESLIIAIDNPAWLIGTVLPNLLSEGSVTKQWRVKNSILRLLSNELVSVKESNAGAEWLDKRLRFLLVKLCSMYVAPDVDAFSKETLAHCLQALHSLRPVQFYSILTSEKADPLSPLYITDSQFEMVVQLCPSFSKFDKADSGVTLIEHTSDYNCAESATSSNGDCTIVEATPVKKGSRPLLPFSTLRNQYHDYGSPSIDTLLLQSSQAWTTKHSGNEQE